MATDSMTTRRRRPEALWFSRWVGYLLVAIALLSAFRAVDFARFVFCEGCRPLFGSLGVVFYVALALIAWRLWVVWRNRTIGEGLSRWKGMLIAVYACLLFPIMLMFSLGSIADIAGVAFPPALFSVVGLGVSFASLAMLAVTTVHLAREK
jgi:hypothetical protein